MVAEEPSGGADAGHGTDGERAAATEEEWTLVGRKAKKVGGTYSQRQQERTTEMHSHLPRLSKPRESTVERFRRESSGAESCPAEAIKRRKQSVGLRSRPVMKASSSSIPALKWQPTVPVGNRFDGLLKRSAFRRDVGRPSRRVVRDISSGGGAATGEEGKVVQEGMCDVSIGLRSKSSKDAGRGSPLKQVKSNGRGPIVENDSLRQALHYLRGIPVTDRGSGYVENERFHLDGKAVVRIEKHKILP